ncbi:MAG: DUF3467 domain-containing protein [Tannerella sp.]|jgi:hypothetical protein|nr:DUF3467 domain-containing protein [Tannerella sp.]
MNNNSQKQNEIQVELSDEIAQGTYANLAIIAHSSAEFIIDFIRIVPGAQKAKVKSRIILTPDNAKRLLYALQDNIQKFDDMTKNGGVINNNPFGNIIPPIGTVTGQA